MEIADVARVRYARREARVVLSSGVTVRAGESFRHRGDAVDLSRHGLGIVLPRGILPGTRVTIALESPELPGVFVLDDLPPLMGKVVSSKRLVRDRYRVGLLVDFLPRGLEELVGDAMNAPAEVQGDGGALEREALYQVACTRLEAKEYDGALRAAVQALDGDPDNRAYRALAYRASAEDALARGHAGDALWHLMKARACAPRDEAIRSLLSYLRVSAATPAAA
jgi:hypothetical protein